MAYRCPACDAIVFVRRLGYCVACKAPLPEEMLPSSEEIELLDQRLREQEETLRARDRDRMAEQGVKVRRRDFFFPFR